MNTAVAPMPTLSANYPNVAPSVASGQGQGLSDKHDFSQRYLTAGMSDGERELRIAKHVSMAQHFFGEWDRESNFSDRGAAERHLMLAADLIAGRSAEQAARLYGDAASLHAEMAGARG